jgi:hypothetical protein
VIEKISPLFSVDTARDIVRNNGPVEFVIFHVRTDETWLPQILSHVGFFSSNGEVKRNRSDLWRDLVPGETVELRWADITIVHDSDSSVESI